MPNISENSLHKTHNEIETNSHTDILSPIEQQNIDKLNEINYERQDLLKSLDSELSQNDDDNIKYIKDPIVTTDTIQLNKIINNQDPLDSQDPLDPQDPNYKYSNIFREFAFDDKSLDNISILEEEINTTKLSLWRRMFFKLLHFIGFYHVSLPFLYLSHIFSSLTDRSWSFVIPLVYSAIYPSTFVPVALYLLIECSTSAALGAYSGYIVDRFPRLKVITLSLFIQNLSVALSGISLFFLFMFENQKSTGISSMFETHTPQMKYGYFVPTFMSSFQISQSLTTENPSPLKKYFPFSNVICFLLWISSTIFGCIAATMSMITDISKKKDWIVVIATSHNLNLTDINSVVKRISLLCNIVAPFIVTSIISLFGIQICMCVISIWNVISFFPEWMSLLLVYRITPNLAVKSTTNEPKESSSMILLTGWKNYFIQTVTLPSIAYIFLYFTVLSNSALLISFLVSVQISELSITIFVTLTAIFGVVSTFIAPYFVKIGGLVYGGFSSLWFQFISLFIGLLFFFLGFNILQYKWCIYLFLAMIIVSRIGLWGFDLAESEIMQIGVKESSRGKINAIESSLSKIAEIGMYLLGIFVADPNYFVILAFASVGCVLIACLLYSLWSLFYGTKFLKIVKTFYELKDVHPKTEEVSSMDIEPTESLEKTEV